MASLKWFYSFLRKYRFYMLGGLGMTTLIVVLSMVNPQISGMIVDDVIHGGETKKLLPLVGLMLLTTAFISILRYCHQIIYEKASQGVLYDMRNKVYRKLLQEDFQFYNRKRTGDLMSRQTGDMDAIRHFVAYTIYVSYQYALYFIFALTMIFTINTKLAWAMLTVLPFTLLNTFLQSQKIRPAFKRNRECFSALNAFVQENISGNRVVRAFAKEEFEVCKFAVENDNYRSAQIAASRVWMRFLPVYEILAYALNIILMLYGGYLSIKGEITLGNLVTVNGYLWMLNSPLRMIGWRINEIINFMTSLEKIYTTYKEEPKVKTPPKGLKKKRLEGAVEFRNVSYRADEEDIVMNIDFKVEPGQTVGIIGATGSGKTTIMNLLCRFYDVSAGQVLIDGTDVRNMNLYNLRDNIGMAMQEVFLFSDTIEGNIAYGRPNCSFEEVKKAAVMADANHFIQEMPEGYDTIVGERGVG
ncbi:MAG: ABC transporter ATP-binding protein, partial [Lachnospiraceae bacterium]|nr:ABC transporter ATP-binding protein [Lachnospiraceae bacterium]